MRSRENLAFAARAPSHKSAVPADLPRTPQQTGSALSELLSNMKDIELRVLAMDAYPDRTREVKSTTDIRAWMETNGDPKRSCSRSRPPCSRGELGASLAYATEGGRVALGQAGLARNIDGTPTHVSAQVHEPDGHRVDSRLRQGPRVRLGSHTNSIDEFPSSAGQGIRYRPTDVARRFAAAVGWRPLAVGTRARGQRGCGTVLVLSGILGQLGFWIRAFERKGAADLSAWCLDHFRRRRKLDGSDWIRPFPLGPSNPQGAFLTGREPS